jgi:hypothetical protein
MIADAAKKFPDATGTLPGASKKFAEASAKLPITSATPQGASANVPGATGNGTELIPERKSRRNELRMITKI